MGQLKNRSRWSGHHRTGAFQSEKPPKLGNIRCDMDGVQSGWKGVALYELGTTNQELIHSLAFGALNHTGNLSRLFLFCSESIEGTPEWYSWQGERKRCKKSGIRP